MSYIGMTPGNSVEELKPCKSDPPTTVTRSGGVKITLSGTHCAVSKPAPTKRPVHSGRARRLQDASPPPQASPCLHSGSYITKAQCKRERGLKCRFCAACGEPVRYTDDELGYWHPSPGDREADWFDSDCQSSSSATSLDFGQLPSPLLVGGLGTGVPQEAPATAIGNPPKCPGAPPKLTFHRELAVAASKVTVHNAIVADHAADNSPCAAVPIAISPPEPVQPARMVTELRQMIKTRRSKKPAEVALPVYGPSTRPAPESHPLDGYTATRDQVATALSEFTFFPVLKQFISFTDRKLEYNRERRLAYARNVNQIQEDIRVVQASYTTFKHPRSFAVCLAAIVVLCLLTSCVGPVFEAVRPAYDLLSCTVSPRCPRGTGHTCTSVPTAISMLGHLVPDSKPSYGPINIPLFRATPGTMPARAVQHAYRVYANLAGLRIPLPNPYRAIARYFHLVAFEIKQLNAVPNHFIVCDAVGSTGHFVHRMMSPWHSHRRFCYACLAVGIGLALLSFTWSARRRTIHLAYCPHIVSCVLCEYARGTNATSVASTIDQKVRRLACLPLPDIDMVEVSFGSQALCLVILADQKFFTGGVASLRQPL